MISNVFITSDFLMTKEKEQFSNVKWLFDILSRPLKNATSLTPVIFTSSLMAEERLSRTSFFEKSGIDLDIHKTQFYFDDKSINNESLEYLSSFIPEDTLIIGYELSEQTRKILIRLKCNYIDIWLHPIRFLDDVLFGMSSNAESIFHEINKFKFSEEYYWLYADRLKIGAYKGWRRVIENLNILPNSALFIGQTMEDKAVCKAGKMLNLLDFKKKFEELGRKYNKVYYSRHPFLKNEDKDIIEYVESCSFAKITSDPTYYLLTHPNIKKVVSISSSVATEAHYFSKENELWFKPIFREKGEYSLDRYVPVFHKFMYSHFWSGVLKPIHETNDCEPVEFIHTKDKIRDMLGFYWSYKQVDKLEHIRNWLLAVD